MSQDGIVLAFLLTLFAAFGILGIAFLRKKRSERLKTLEELLPQEISPSPGPASLGAALSNTRQSFWGKIAKTLSSHSSSQEEIIWVEIERALFSADVGAQTADKILTALRQDLTSKDLLSPGTVKAALKKETSRILHTCSGHGRPFQLDSAAPTVLMFVGVNGVGKTTTIGKVAAQLKSMGKKVLLGAGDTFRAAAAEQLNVWAERAEVPIVQGSEQADPASVLFEAVSKGKAEGFDVVLCDTAGRLHTKTNLMDELAKVHRVVGKALPGAPHEVWLVLDATMGQNALMQAKQFGQSIPLTGVVLTKLDGTAKGGVIVGIVDQLQLPIRLIGIGEKLSDLQPFDTDAFIEALFVEEGENL